VRDSGGFSVVVCGTVNGNEFAVRKKKEALTHTRELYFKVERDVQV
jgi:hypothetical protein